MTRINIIDPVDLMDQHLVAEYREIFMIGSSLQRSLASPNWNDEKIPTRFTLNKGHVMFFYNKGLYLHKRYKMLRAEMERRGMKPDPARQFKVEQWPKTYFNDWTATEADKDIVRERLLERIAKKPHWYRYTSVDSYE